MKQYEFIIYVVGMGNTPEEAWEDCVQTTLMEGFGNDVEAYAMPSEGEYKVIDEWED